MKLAKVLDNGNSESRFIQVYSDLFFFSDALDEQMLRYRMRDQSVATSTGA
ncbi:hypothetical protein ACTVH1_09675 [Gluconobacter cerinus]|uniref:hypothetical protein n=1 Tax=Gluconobacter cerinus TaxID=38307 RepID=UPI001B8AAF1F|nr:hypothetical protein [Gluconobacter cerinus]MBS1073111.1 hypothetical protein [Gluconobacter cerinus]